MLNKVKFIVGLLLILSFNLQAAEQPPLTHKLTAVTPLVSAPELKLQNMDDESVDIKSLQGKVVIVNFWATWCPPCRREMTSLEKLYQATKDKNVTVLAVNIGEDDETAFSFLNSIDPATTFPVLFDTDSLTMQKWEVMGLPTTYVLDSEGRIAYKAVGGREFDHPELMEKVLALTVPEKAENAAK